jgi:pimeloyl-ACP methyl ester carboxylesterase
MPYSPDIYYHFHDTGDHRNMPLLLIPGVGGDHLSWSPEIRRLPGSRVYALDLPGHGRSSGAGCQSVEESAKRIVRFMDDVGTWRAFLVGHSLGGAIALTTALEFQERVAGLVLMSCGARLPVPAKILENAASQATFPLAVDMFVGLICGSSTPASLSIQAHKRLYSIRPSLLYGDLLACRNYDVSDRLESIQSPVLVVCGAEDKLTPVYLSSFLATRLPRAALQVVDGAGHQVVLEQPQRIAKILSIFIRATEFSPSDRWNG